MQYVSRFSCSLTCLMAFSDMYTCMPVCLHVCCLTVVMCAQKILAEEAAKKNRETVTDAMVKEAQERVAKEAQTYMSFSWQ